MDTRNLELGEKCCTFAERFEMYKGGKRPPDVAGRNGI